MRLESLKELPPRSATSNPSATRSTRRWLRSIASSEFADASGPVRAVMFWVEPELLGEAPRYAKRHFAREERQSAFRVLASGRGAADSSALHVRRDVVFAAAALTSGRDVRYRLEPLRRAYLLSTDAAVWVNGSRVEAGDRVLATGPGELAIRAEGTTEVILLDV